MSERTFTMDLTPSGITGCVLLDGEDISQLLTGVSVDSDVLEGTVVTLRVRKGQRVQLVARLPEAKVRIVEG